MANTQAYAQKRVALVIGMSDYSKVARLPNPVNDADAMAAMFRAHKFDLVEAHNNLNNAELRRTLNDFYDKSAGADVAVVYFAGHGVEIDGTNYLIPVDASLERDRDAVDEAVPLDRALLAVEHAKRLRLVILDACRDNPFLRSMKRTLSSRSLSRGLADVEPGHSNSLVAFAAKAGSTAQDGAGGHSPYTKALLEHLATGGLDIRIALGRVRDDVLSATDNQQEPFVYGSLGGSDVTLVPATGTTSSGDTDLTRSDYDAAERIGTKDAWSRFLKTYPSGYYSDLAKLQLQKIDNKTEASTLTKNDKPADKSSTAKQTAKRSTPEPEGRSTDRAEPPGGNAKFCGYMASACTTRGASAGECAAAGRSCMRTGSFVGPRSGMVWTRSQVVR